VTQHVETSSGRGWNILFIMTDQHRWDALGCAGGWVETPVLDRLASEGVRFASAVTNAPGCVPARASLATGLYAHDSGVWRNGPFRLDPATPNWMRAIRDVGYSTALFGKAHLHASNTDLRDHVGAMQAIGFETVNEIPGPWGSRYIRSHMSDAWQSRGLWTAFQRDLDERATHRSLVRPSPLDLDAYYDTYVAREAQTYLRRYDDSRPWFLCLSFAGPHEPWDAPEPYASRYHPGDMPPAIARPSDACEAPHGLLHERLLSEGPWRSHLDAGDVARLRANYAGEVSLIDDRIGEVLDTVRDRGELDRTVIAFASDHGEMNGDYGLLFKSVFLNGAVRIPMIIRTPDTARRPVGRVYQHPVELMDLGLTLAGIAGAPSFRLGSARSLAPVLDGSDAPVRDEVLAEVRGEYMLMDDEWKIAFRPDFTPYLLFDRPADPDEVHNLAGRPATAAIERALTDRLRQRIASSSPAVPEPVEP